MADDALDIPASDGPRKHEVLRYVRASMVMRGRAVAATSPDRKTQCLAEADRLMAVARDLAKADEDAAEFERAVRSRGGVWFPGG